MSKLSTGADQKGVLEQILRDHSNFKKTGASRRTASYLTGRLLILEGNFKNALGLQAKIRRGEIEEGLEEEDFDEIFDLLQETYFTYRGELVDAIDNAKSASKEKNVEGESTGGSCNELSLPQIQIPHFEGSYTKWRAFHDVFLSLVHTNKKLGEIQKLHYLKSCLTGEAARLFQHLGLYSGNYDKAWELLVARYDHKRVLVNAHFQLFFEQQQLTKETASNIKSLLDTSQECFHALDNLGLPVSSWDDILIYILVQHSLRTCQKFIAMEICERSKAVDRIGVCGNCLANSHKTNHCQSSVRCYYCKQAHHSLLHVNNLSSKPTRDYKNITPGIQTLHIRSKFNPPKVASSEVHHPSVLLATAVVRVRSSNGNYFNLRALVDPGSEATFITESAIQLLGLHQRRTIIQVSGLGKVSSGSCQRYVSLTFGSLVTRFETNTPAYVFKSLTGLLPSKPLVLQNWEHIQGLKLADPQFDKPASVDILLGADVYSDFILGSIIRSDDERSPITQESELGWLILGKVISQNKKPVHSFLQDLDNDTQLRRSWELEEFNTKKTAEEKTSENNNVNTITRSPDGRYEVSQPLKDGCKPGFGASRLGALRRFHQLEGRFQETPTLHKKLQQMKEVDETNIILDTPHHFFTPHHVVFNKPECKPGFGASKLGALRRFHQLEGRFQKIPTQHKEHSQCLTEYKELPQMTEVDKKNTILYTPHHFLAMAGLHSFRVISYKLQQSSLTTSEFCQIETKKGPIKGVKRNTVYGEPYYSFEKIPFAKPPLGELRFKAPVSPEPWTDVIDCTQSCQKPLQENFIFKNYKGSEDCLYLNVYSRNLKPEKPAPVMVWIYGGGFQIGEATRELYGPDYFMSKDVVIVSLTYRLGPFGFLSLKDPKVNIPGNAGLKDQILGLRWVNENISIFGGDPNNVTLFGESAGAASTHLIMLSEQTKGLFHKAIIQSGSALNHWAMPPANSWPYRLAVSLGYKDEDDDQAVIEFLTKAHGPDIVKAAPRITSKDEKKNRILFAFGPVVEPYITDSCVLPAEPLEMMQASWSNNIPLMIGGNSHEGLLFIPEIRRRPVTLEEVKDCEYLVPLDLGLDRESGECKEFGLRIKKAHFGDKECEQSTLMEYLDLLSYKMFWHGLHRAVLSRLEFSAAPTYLFRFEFDSATFNMIRNLICGKGHKGACHGDELCYLFHNTFSHKLSKDTIEYKTLERMIGIWTNFAATSNPNCEAISDVKIEPLAKSDNVLKCINISNDVKVIDLPEADKLAVWDSMYSKSRLYGKQ